MVRDGCALEVHLWFQNGKHRCENDRSRLPEKLYSSSEREMAQMQPVMMTAVQVTVPDGVQPGQQFQVNTPSGLMAVTCPSGVSSGGQMIVNVPAAVAAPAPQAMARPHGASPQVDALVEALGGSITIRMGADTRYEGTKTVGNSGFPGNTIAADLKVLDAAGKEALVLSFRSSNRTLGELHATLKGTDGTVLAELQQEPRQAQGGIMGALGITLPSASASPDAVVRVGGVTHGTISAPLYTWPSYKRVDGTSSVTSAPPTNCICCPCQTMHSTWQVAGGQPLHTKSEVDWDGPLCCNWNTMLIRKLTYELPGDARVRLETLVLISYCVAGSLAAPPQGGNH
eukprot:5439262-Prymnesium_polylepis.1